MQGFYNYYINALQYSNRISNLQKLNKQQGKTTKQSYFFVHSFAVAKNLVLSVLSSWGGRSAPESKDNSCKELPLQYRVQTGHRGLGY